MQDLASDVRFAWRHAVRAWPVSAVVVVTMALATGASTAIFSVAHGVLLRPLPFHDPASLVAASKVHEERRSEPPFPEYRVWLEHPGPFTELAAANWTEADVQLDPAPVRVHHALVTANYFRVLGIRPVLGRLFAPGDDDAGSERVIVLSEGAWRRWFGAREDVIGASLTLGNHYDRAGPYRIIGVAPHHARLHHFEVSCDTYIPLAPVAAMDSWLVGGYSIIGRLAPGVSTAQASEALTTVSREATRDLRIPDTLRAARTDVRPLHEVEVGPARHGVLLVSAAVALMVLIGCVNIAGLLLGAGGARASELAVRVVTGASRWRLVRQLLTEMLLLALAGGGLGLLGAGAALGVLVAGLPADLPRADEIRLDAVVLGFAALATVTSGLLFSLLPAWRLSRADPARALRPAGLTPSRRGALLRDGLLAAQTALILALLVSAGLALHSFMRLATVDVGFDAGRLAAAEFTPGPAYRDPAAYAAFEYHLRLAALALPDVHAAGVTSGLPPHAFGQTSLRLPDGTPASPVRRQVSPGYLEALGVPLLDGRRLEDADRGTRNIVVNAAFVAQHLGGGRAVGEFLPVTGNEPYRIVGVIGDVREWRLTEPARPAFYQFTTGSGTQWLVVRTAGRPQHVAESLRAVFAREGPSVPVQRVLLADEHLGTQRAEGRFYAMVFGALALLALTLAAVGMLGSVHYTVTERRQEIGIRLALGASAGAIARLLVGRVALLGAGAIAFGLWLGLLNARALGTVLYGLTPSDMPTLAGVSLVLLAVLVAAAWLPTRAATRIDPLTTLRQ
jgi:predicted permease